MFSRRQTIRLPPPPPSSRPATLARRPCCTFKCTHYSSGSDSRTAISFRGLRDSLALSMHLWFNGRLKWCVRNSINGYVDTLGQSAVSGQFHIIYHLALAMFRSTTYAGKCTLYTVQFCSICHPTLTGILCVWSRLWSFRCDSKSEWNVMCGDADRGTQC